MIDAPVALFAHEKATTSVSNAPHNPLHAPSPSSRNSPSPRRKTSLAGTFLFAAAALAFAGISPCAYATDYTDSTASSWWFATPDASATGVKNVDEGDTVYLTATLTRRTSGSFTNWFGGIAPVRIDTNFNPEAAGVTLYKTGAGTLVLNTDGTTEIGNISIIAGVVEVSNDDTKIQLIDNGSNVDANNGHVLVGAQVGNEATFNMSAGKITAEVQFIVGFSGTGTFNISGTAQIETGTTYSYPGFTVGNNTGSVGYAYLTDNATITTGNSFVVGMRGTGTFTVSGNAIYDSGSSGTLIPNIDAKSISVGRDVGGVGTMYVSGHSTVKSTGDVVAGEGNGGSNNSGTNGVINVSEYGTVYAQGNIILGNFEAAQGTITVTDNGSIHTDNAFFAGYNNNGLNFISTAPSIGTVRVSGSGSIVTGSQFVLGRYANSIGYMQVSGSGYIEVGTFFMIGQYPNQNAGHAEVTENGYIKVNGTSLNYRGVFLQGASSTLTIGGNAHIETAAHYYQNPNTTLTIHLGDGTSARAANDAYIVANSTWDNTTLAGTLVLTGVPNFPGIDTSSGLQSTHQSLIQIKNSQSFSGSFSTVTTNDIGTTPDYISFTGTGIETLSSIKSYYAGYDLTWKSDAAKAHGTFTIPAGKTFTVNTPDLTSRNGITSGWDGSSLLKQGTGTLVISNTTNVTKMTVAAGVLRLAGTGKHTVGDIFLGTPATGGNPSDTSSSVGTVLHLDSTDGVTIFAAAVTLHLTKGNFLELNIDVSTQPDRTAQIGAILDELKSVGGTSLVELTGWTGEAITSILVNGANTADEIATLDRVLKISTASATSETGTSPYPLGAPTGKVDDPLNPAGGGGLAGVTDSVSAAAGSSSTDSITPLAAGGSIHTYITLGIPVPPITPEPSTYAALGAALLAGLLYLRRRRRHR